jgi:glutathione synthase/RimK-type ligase-like ATP-grasp enzyme
MKIRIEPYKTWSGGAKALGQRCGILRATNKQVAKHGDFDTIINWGRSEARFNGTYINDPGSVGIASNKQTAFMALQEAGDVPIPEFTNDRDVAQGWVDSGEVVVVRQMLRGSQGRGIVLVGPKDNEVTTVYEVPPAPLYVKYVKKQDEYRLHVAFGEVIDIQQKKRKLEVPDDQVNWQLRNHDNGWVFARDGVSAPKCVISAAIASCAALGLDFGAVDIGYNAKAKAATVYEVNTAPGLEGETLESYYKAFMKKFPQLGGGMYAKRRAKLA